MRPFVCLVLALFCFSLSIHAQSYKSRESANLKKEPLEFDLDVKYLKSEDGRILTEFIVEVKNKDIAFKKSKTNYEAKIKMYARILNVTQEKITFENEISIFANESELNKIKFTKTKYTKIISLPAKTHRIDIIFWDVISKRRSVRTKAFTVPEKLGKKKNDKINKK